MDLFEPVSIEEVSHLKLVPFVNRSPYLLLKSHNVALATVDLGDVAELLNQLEASLSLLAFGKLINLVPV